MKHENNKTDLAAIRKIFKEKKNRGAAAELARRLSPNPKTGKPVPRSSVSRYLRGGFPSERFDAAVLVMIEELARRNNVPELPSGARGDFPNA